MKNPCFNCERRTASCHGSCGDYTEFCRENEKIREARALQIAAGQSIITPGYIRTHIRKLKKRRGKV